MSKRTPLTLDALSVRLYGAEQGYSREKRYIWSIVDTTARTRTEQTRTVTVKATREPFNPTGYEGDVATLTMTGAIVVDALLNPHVSYRLGSTLMEALA